MKVTLFKNLEKSPTADMKTSNITKTTTIKRYWINIIRFVFPFRTKKILTFPKTGKGPSNNYQFP